MPNLLSSRTIRTGTFLIIGLAFLNISLHMLGIFRYQMESLNNKFIEPVHPNIELEISMQKYMFGYPTNPMMSSISSSVMPNDTGTFIDPPEMEVFHKTNNFTFNENSTTTESSILCPEIPPALGPFDGDVKKFEEVKGNLSKGGYYKHRECKPRRKLAIIVPVRYLPEYKEHLVFISRLHQFLMKQQLEYQIFIVGQNNSEQEFIRGRLINVGFLEIRRRFPQYHCFVIHAPNIAPVDSRNLYRCSWYPRQLAVFIEKSDKSIVEPSFGEAVALTAEQFSEINGFSNRFASENNQDYNEVYNRLMVANYVVEKSPEEFGKFVYLYAIYGPISLTTSPSTTKSNQHNVATSLFDGISSIAYTEETFEYKKYYTYISVTFPEDVIRQENIFAKSNTYLYPSSP